MRVDFEKLILNEMMLRIHLGEEGGTIPRMSVSELASALRKSPQAVRNRLRSARWVRDVVGNPAVAR